MQISAGLGNQMFQYASGYAIAKSLGVNIKLDLSTYTGQSLARLYDLDKFNIDAGILTRSEKLRLRLSFGKTLGRFYSVFPFRDKLLYDLVVDKQSGFDASVYKIDKPTFLRGYWQSHLYFAHSREDIVRNFTFSRPISEKDTYLFDVISGENSICVHVRRGDYVTNPIYKKTFVVQESEYYRQAEGEIASRVRNPKFYVFSDDSEWAQDNLRFNSPTTVVSGQHHRADWEELRLMMACKHFIIANSTFSWWAAWLGRHPDKVVIAPTKWRHGISQPPRDLIPKEWICV